MLAMKACDLEPGVEGKNHLVKVILHTHSDIHMSP